VSKKWCILKLSISTFRGALSVTGDKKLCEGGKYIGIRKDKSHDLAKLARKADVATSEAEAHLLDRLRDVSVGWGRYPIHQSFDVDAQRKGTKWASPDEILFQSLIRRLVKPFDKQSVYTDLLKEA
jgi:hypothetical protein